MSDTVKLIIEIPKSALELLNTTGVDWLDAEHILSAVANGTPLDDLRADLHATAEMHSDGDYYLRDEWIDEYFDDIGSAESEGKLDETNN